MVIFGFFFFVVLFGVYYISYSINICFKNNFSGLDFLVFIIVYLCNKNIIYKCIKFYSIFVW